MEKWKMEKKELNEESELSKPHQEKIERIFPFLSNHIDQFWESSIGSKVDTIYKKFVPSKIIKIKKKKKNFKKKI